MEIVEDFVNNHLTLFLPVVGVVLLLVLIFTYSIKGSHQQPPFDKFTIDDRKQAAKKKKIKDKKTTANGHVIVGDSKTDKSPAKESKRSPVKEASEGPKTKKVENNKLTEKAKNEAVRNKTIEEAKNKKNAKKQFNEKPVDFDDGDWETVPSKADKKNKKPDQSPSKKEISKKSNKKVEKITEIEKLVKEVTNKELREKELKDAIEVEEPVVKNEEPVVVIEEKKEKKKEKKAKKEADINKTEIKIEMKIAEKEPRVQEVPKPKAEKIVPEVKEETSTKTAAKDVGVAFDELGDIWTEAKAAKKSKKKARRDN